MISIDSRFGIENLKILKSEPIVDKLIPNVEDYVFIDNIIYLVIKKVYYPFEGFDKRINIFLKQENN